MSYEQVSAICYEKISQKYVCHGVTINLPKVNAFDDMISRFVSNEQLVLKEKF